MFYLFYRLLLSRDTFHRFNRMALLGVIVFSIAIPFVQLAADGHVAQEVAVHDLGGVGGRELVPFHPLVDAEAKDRFGEDAALLLIELADGEHHFDHDVAVGLGFAVTVGAGIAPLHPAA